MLEWVLLSFSGKPTILPFIKFGATAFLSRMNKTDSLLFETRRSWDQEVKSLFSISIPGNESLSQTQIISLCLSFAFYKVEIIIPNLPYFLHILWKEIDVYVSPREGNLESKHCYFYFLLPNSLHGNHSFLFTSSQATSGLVTYMSKDGSQITAFKGLYSLTCFC